MSSPQGIASGPDGNLWFTNSSGDSIGRITPAGVVSNYTGGGISYPQEITAGPDGNLWFTNSGSNSIGKITPAGAVSNFAVLGGSPQGIAVGPDHNLWFTNNTYTGTGTSASIGRITTTGAVSSFAVAGTTYLQGITAGPDGNLWFTNYPYDGSSTASIGRITTGGTLIDNFTGADISGPGAIAAGPDGNLWFTNNGAGAASSIGRITPAGLTTSFTDPALSFPQGITAGADGNLWFADGGSVGRITPVGAFSSFAGPVNSSLQGITAGPGGYVWFTNPGGDSIGKVTPVGVVSNYTGNGINSPLGIAAGSDGNLWFTNYGGDSIGKVTPAGVVSNYTGGGISSPVAITAGPDGNVWFTDSGIGSIGMVTPTGMISNFPIPGSGSPQGIAAGPDGNLWFTVDTYSGNSSTGSIGRVTPAGVVSIFPAAGTSNLQGIAAGPDGNLWFTNDPYDGTTPSIGRITIAGTVTGNFTDAGINGPVGIAAGPDGNLWFTNSAFGSTGPSSSIGRITSAGVVTAFTDPGISNPQGITAGPDGNLWFADGGSIGQITPGGVVQTFADPAINGAQGITAGPDGNMWFTTFGSVIGYVGTSAPPAAPSGVSATAGNGQATVSWSAPASVGSSPVTSYTVTASPGGQTCTWSAGPLSCTVSSLTNGTSYTLSVVATNLTGAGPASASSNTVVPKDGMVFHPLSPARIEDSRSGTHVGPYSTPWGAGQTRDVVASTVGGVPAAADAVVVNVAVTGTSSAGYLTMWPSDQPQPLASSLNWAAGQTIANAVTVKVGAAGKVSVFNPSGTVDVIVDVVGYYDTNTGDGFTSLTPARIQDSRSGLQVGPYSTPWAGGQTRDVAATSVGGVPSGADAVVVNVAVTDASSAGYLTIWPSGQPQPLASSLNWVAGQTIANAVTVKVGAGGKVSIFNPSGTVDVIVDVVGSFAPGTGHLFHPLSPARILDSRSGGLEVGPYGTPWTANQMRDATVTSGGVPVGADAVVLNVAVTDTTSAGYLTIWPSGQAQPLASSLNWVTGETIANAVTVKVGAGGKVSVFNPAGTVDVIADAAGYYA